MRDWLSHRVVSSPDEIGLVRAEDGEAWTYADLDRLVSETAGRLAAHGISENDRLGVLTPPYVGTVGLVHATMRVGATFVPLGEDLTPRELGERVERADLDAVVCAESTESDALAAVEDVPLLSVDEPGDAAVTAVHDVDPDPVDAVEWTFDDPLCILFTSGTTGVPKPVPLTAGNLYASAVASAFRLGVDPDDRWLVSLALHHMGGLAPVYRAVLYGTTLVLREGFDPGGTADDIDRYDVTGVSLVPTMLERMLDRRGTLADSLRVVLLGGAPAPEELIERCRDYSIPVYPTYGMTEAASQVTTATPKATRDRPDTVGRPVFGTDVTVVDEAGEPVGAGETGEVVVDGPTITPGYLDPDATGSDVTDPDATDSEFGPYGLHTGDVGTLDEEGYLYVFNRLDDRIVTGGENVEPGEVSDVLAGHAAVDDVAVVGLSDDDWGERVAALVEVRDRPRGGGVNREDAAPNDERDGLDDEAETDGTEVDDVEAADDEDGAVDGRDDVSGNGADGDGSEAVDERDDDTGDDDLGIDPEGATGTGNGTDSAGVDPALDDSLLAFARDRLAGFKIPKTVAYTDEIPRTVSGTIDRDAVRERLRETGHDPRDGFGVGGFEPADPEPADSESTDPEPADRTDPERAGPADPGDTAGFEGADGSLDAHGVEPERARTDLTTEVFSGDGPEGSAEPEDDRVDRSSNDDEGEDGENGEDGNDGNDEKNGDDREGGDDDPPEQER
ncbi:O-succinylbenzoic acid--CoA ligase [Halorubrum aquaticum]|uniref:O-succinylbenzoic acid--CoA ligase n=1 Tax=Halorubrum aquaticum TaxID=387340 RepID=A0A1I3AXG9_9EURY|nr:AMP-binding protein [Halorubrum aquaticum]SFH54692.1 O-succinylbenzoic acid--CoA ligase [Halorubrum aquaticum]